MFSSARQATLHRSLWNADEPSCFLGTESVDRGRDQNCLKISRQQAKRFAKIAVQT